MTDGVVQDAVQRTRAALVADRGTPEAVRGGVEGGTRALHRVLHDPVRHAARA